MNTTKPRILITGANGYVGAQLLPLLEQKGYPITCLYRTKAPQVLMSGTRLVKGDLLDPPSLAPALAGVHTAYYLVHSMNDGPQFEAREKKAAANFITAAESAGVKRIVYLGALAHETSPLSKHLQSRMDTGRILRSSKIPVTEFRASIVIGAGSISFEMIRALVEKLPVMITPKWVKQKSQPIYIKDLLAYLVGALQKNFDGHRCFEIGGPEPISYGNLMMTYAKARGLQRIMIPVPVLSPGLSAWWLHVFAPRQSLVGKALLESITHSTVLSNTTATSVFSIKPKGVFEAIQNALDAETHHALLHKPHNTSALKKEVFTLTVPGATSLAFEPVTQMGGQQGWYYGNVLWKLRGLLDQALGGPGLSKGRKHPYKLKEGAFIDCWRVEKFVPHQRLLLEATMKMPGKAHMQWEAFPLSGNTQLVLTILFRPSGLLGKVYWDALLSLHRMLWRGLLRAVKKKVVKHRRFFINQHKCSSKRKVSTCLNA